MALRKKEHSKGPVFVLIITTLVVAILSLILSLFEVQANKTIISNGTLESVLVTVNNIFSVDGIKYLFNNIISNFRLFEPLVLLIISLIGISIGEKSGLLHAIFSPLKKIKFNIIIFLTILTGIISTVIGDYSYVFLIPVIGVIYKYQEKNPMLGILIMFISITIGQGAGIIFNYNDHLLGLLTQASATLDVDPNYGYNLFAYLYIMIFSTLALSYIGTIVIEKLLVTKFTRKYEYENEFETSKKGKRVSLIVFLVLVILTIYSILDVNLPLAGMLLDSDSSRYMDKLFGPNAPFGNGLVFIISGIMMICGYIYGKISKNIKDGSDFSLSLSKNFENLGFLFVLLFFISQIIAIVEWTNIGTLISCWLVTVLGNLQISGILLILIFILFVIVMTILIPSIVTKWELISPTIVPLFMRSNIAPALTQFVFRASDAIGKSFNPFNAYFIITLAFLEKYRVNEKEQVTIFGIFKLILPIVAILSFTLVAIILLWYLIGLPIGTGIYANL